MIGKRKNTKRNMWQIKNKIKNWLVKDDIDLLQEQIFGLKRHMESHIRSYWVERGYDQSEDNRIGEFLMAVKEYLDVEIKHVQIPDMERDQRPPMKDSIKLVKRKKKC